MCGIYGEFRIAGGVDLRAAFDRLQSLGHRGPDGFGTAFGHLGDSGVVLHNRPPHADPAPIQYFIGHRRLTIVDLSDDALQPMSDVTGRYQIAFNGEIYNAAGLRSELLAKGHVFKTDHSDTEALLHAYIEWGEACLEHLNGMFAFAVHDTAAKRVFLARDRLGQKPLYYRASADGLAFASELTPLLGMPGDNSVVDRVALAQYLMLGYIPDPRTLFSDIKKLPPAHFAVVDLTHSVVNPRLYWEPPMQPDRDMSAAEAEGLISRRLAESVQARLIADVPIGLFLSGGIDSTLVAKMVHQSGGNVDRAFCADFADPDRSTRKWAEQAARGYEIDLEVTLLDALSADRYQDVLRVQDEPFDGGSAITSHELYRLAEGEVKVVLTGDGGDELFAGYSRYRNFETYRRLLTPLRRARLAGIVRRPLERLRSRSYGRRELDALVGGDDLLAFAYRGARAHMMDLLIDPPRDHGEAFDFVDIARGLDRRMDMKTVQFLELRSNLPGRMLYKADRYSMSFGIEVRSPFMDHQLVEAAFLIPTRHLAGLRTGKKVLKHILERDLGRSFVHRPKQGFDNPLAAWFSDGRADEMVSSLVERDQLIYEWLDFDSVMAAYPTILGNGTPDRGTIRELWRLVVLAEFLEGRRRHIHSS